MADTTYRQISSYFTAPVYAYSHQNQLLHQLCRSKLLQRRNMDAPTVTSGRGQIAFCFIRITILLEP